MTDPKKLAEEYAYSLFGDVVDGDLADEIIAHFLAGWNACAAEKAAEMEKLMTVLERLRRVCSKGMIHIQDHHDGAAWKALKEAMEAVE